jgi:type IV secretion system protein VirB4
VNGFVLALAVAVLVVLAAVYFTFRGQGPGLLREFRTTVKGYADLLVYAALVEEGIVLNKDGALLAAWDYRGEDLDAAAPEEMEALSDRVNMALARRGSGWMLHIDAMRQPVNAYAERSHFPDRTTLLIDEERRLQAQALGARFASTYTLTLTYLPPIDQEKRLARALIDGEVRGLHVHDILAPFQSAINEIEDLLGFSLRLQRLDSAALLAHLNHCVVEEVHPIAVPATPMFLDAILGGRDFFGGMKPRVGNIHIRPIALTGFPNESYAGILDDLNHLAMPYRWSSRFIFLDPIEAKKHIERHRKRWFSGRKSVRAMFAQDLGMEGQTENTEAHTMAADAQYAMDDISEGAVRYGFYTSVVIVSDEDSDTADMKAREVVKIFLNRGFNARIEEVNAVEAFLGTHPGNGYANVRKPMIHTRNLADFLPLTAVWCGEEFQPCPYYPPQSPPLAYTASAGASPFRLSLHVGDVGHTFIVGPTGSGKSTLLNFLMASHMRYEGAQVFAFDRGYSAFTLVRACAGEHYDILGGLQRLSFCPLLRIDDDEERAWATGWIETLATLQGVSVTAPRRQAIARALKLLAESESRTITDLIAGPLQDQELRSALNHYTLDGPLGTLLDSRTDSLLDDVFQVFELEHLLTSTGRASEKHVAPVLLYLFHRIEQRLTGRPTLIVIDEAWTVMDHPLFVEQVREWLKTLRKKNAAVVFATQSVADILDKPIATSVIDSCLTKIFLPNGQAATDGAREAYYKMGLGEREITLLAQATPKRDYYYRSPLGRRMFALDLGPVARCFLAASGPADVARVRALVQAHGNYTWPALWLRAHDLDSAASFWLKPGAHPTIPEAV